MAQVTYKTGLVTIPQSAAWPPIHAIRAEHIRHLRRWMPHITPGPVGHGNDRGPRGRSPARGR